MLLRLGETMEGKKIKIIEVNTGLSGTLGLRIEVEGVIYSGFLLED